MPSLVFQALMCGGVVLAPWSDDPRKLGITAALGMVLFMITAFVERFGKHDTTNARQAAAFLGTVRVGPLRAWATGIIVVFSGIAVGHFVPALALVLVLAGLCLYEWAYVRAGQLPPLS